ncbi:hypothetical protein ACFL7M_18740, partial [Thermodesulfobacteriota bacterium]
KPEDSCVSVSTVSQGIRPIPGGKIANDHINNLISSILSRREAVFSLYNPKIANPRAHPMKYVFMITPELADDLAASSYTQVSLRNYIYESACVPYEELSPHEIKTIQTRIDQSVASRGIFSDQLPPDRIPVWQKGLKPGGKVPIMVTPEDLHFIVVGTVHGKSITEWSYTRAPYTWSSHRTTRIESATLTKAER